MFRIGACAFLVVAAACVGAGPDDGGGSGGGGKGDNGGMGGGGGGGGGSGSGSGSGSGGGGGITVSAFLSGMASKDCAEAFTCMSSFPTDNGGTFADEWGTSQQECAASGAMDAAAVSSEIAAGKIHFDGVAAASCLNGTTYPAACTDFWNTGPSYPASCGTALVGMVPDGGACVIYYDCSNPDSDCDETTMTCAVPAQNRTAPSAVVVGARAHDRWAH